MKIHTSKSETRLKFENRDSGRKVHFMARTKRITSTPFLLDFKISFNNRLIHIYNFVVIIYFGFLDALV